ncbi:MAG: HEAT repeat domain-containing protein [Spirochaetes bacterium]|nr:HEAT repeat domain-containing protein [Spirochaetota bacterium]
MMASCNRGYGRLLRGTVTALFLVVLCQLPLITGIGRTGTALAQGSEQELQAERARLAERARQEEASRIRELSRDVVSDDEEESLEAVRQLKARSGGEMLTLWIELLEKAELPRTKIEIIEHLSAAYDRRLVVPLAKELSSPYSDVRRSAARVLKNYSDDRIYPYILSLSSSPNPVYRIYFIEAMNFLYDRRFYELLVGMSRDANKSVRIYALNCLRSNNLTESVPIVRTMALGDGNDEVKVNAIDVLGHFQDRGALYVLLKTLNEPNRDIRLMTAKTLLRLGMPNAAMPLSQRLMVETEDDVKEMIMESLIRVRNSGNISGLARVLNSDRNESLRIKAAFALGVVREQRAVTVLLQGAGDRSVKVRAEVANSLGMYKTSESIGRLLEMTERDDDIYVRSAALYSLKRINDRKTAVPLFDIYSRERDTVFRELLRTVIRDFMNRYL